MGNRLQKFIYNISAASPVLIMFSIVWLLQEKTIKIPLVCLAVAIIFMVCMAISFSYGLKHLAPITIRTSDISPNDGWVVLYIITYLIPFASMAIKDTNIFLFVGIAFLIAVAAPFVNTAIPNPLLFVRGYHFYQVTAENGVSGYVLISKRKLRRKQDLTCVNRVFEFLLLDTKER